MSKIRKQDVVDFLEQQYNDSRLKPDDVTYEVLRNRLGISIHEVKRLTDKAIEAGILVKDSGIRNGKYVVRFNPAPGWEKKINGKNIFSVISQTNRLEPERNSNSPKKRKV